MRPGYFEVQPLKPTEATRRILSPRRRASRLLPGMPVLQEVAEVDGLARAIGAAVEHATGDGILDIRDAGALRQCAAELMAIMLDNQKVTG